MFIVYSLSQILCVTRHQNHLVLSWEKPLPQTHPEFILQLLCPELKEWNTVYRGPKTEVKLKHLIPCTGYELRIKTGEDGEWIKFKSATADGPYLARHMTRAVQQGITPLIRKIAHNRPHLLETENKDLKTPLIQAIEKGDLQVCALLMNLGANVNTPTLNTIRTPLMVAVYCNQLQIASLLVDKGCNVKAVDVNGLNVLHYAVDANNVDCVKFASGLGLDIDCKDRSGWTPLFRAAILSGSEEIVRVLLENGAEKNVRDNNGFDFNKHTELAEWKFPVKTLKFVPVDFDKGRRRPPNCRTLTFTAIPMH